MVAGMVARRTSFIVMTPLFCFFMTARFRGTAHFPRHVLRPDVSGSAEMAQMGQDVGQDDRFIIATIGAGELSRCAKPFRSVSREAVPTPRQKARERGAYASFFPQAEGGDCRLAIALSHLEVTFGVRDDVWIVRSMAAAQGADGELGAPHVRLQLLQRQRSISTRHFSHLREAS